MGGLAATSNLTPKKFAENVLNLVRYSNFLDRNCARNNPANAEAYREAAQRAIWCSLCGKIVANVSSIQLEK